MLYRISLFMAFALVLMGCTTAATPEEAAPVEEGAEISAAEYSAPEPAFDPVPLEQGAQASCAAVTYDGSAPATIAYMPPATEFNYYIAIGAGIEDAAADLGIETFMLGAPERGPVVEVEADAATHWPSLHRLMKCVQQVVLFVAAVGCQAESNPRCVEQPTVLEGCIPIDHARAEPAGS